MEWKYILTYKMSNENFLYSFLKRNRKAVSGVVIMMILVALVMAVMVVVWQVTKGTVEEKLSQAEACSHKNIGKIELNRDYTCYDEEDNKVIFSITRKNIEVDELLISLIGNEESESVVLTNEEKDISGVGYYPSNQVSVKLPNKDAGKTYEAETDFVITQIKIAPKIDNEQCDIIDNINDVPSCSQFNF